MAKVLVNESSLTGIANAIRGKNGSTDTYKPSEMAAAITAISGGGEPTIEALSITANGTYTAPDGVDGYSPVTVNVPQDGGPPESAFVISGDCSYRFANNGWNWFIELYGDKITTKDISSASYMFNNSSITELPFEINFINGGGYANFMFGYCDNLESVPNLNFKHTNYNSMQYLFVGCKKLKEIGTIENAYPSDISNMFQDCERLRQLPEFINLNLSRIQTYTYANTSSLFNGCYSLRSIPENLLKQLYGTWTASYSCAFYSMFYNCHTLDEIKGLNPQTGTITTNMFQDTFQNCGRVKNIIFTTQEGGTPYAVNWKNQTIELDDCIGYAISITYITNYNSGITADKEVIDDATYQALKNDADWFTTKVEYSRYNHDSAVATINSLPDTSAYLASAGGTNTIKFKGAAGSKTDGGAISSLTEEEIAVATAKGWTVTLV